MPKYPRKLFHGEFNSGQSRRARDAACDIATHGARDILYVVGNAAARSAVRSELVARAGGMFGLRVISFRALPIEIERRARVRGVAIADGVVDDVLIEHALRAATRKIGSGDATPGLAVAARETIVELERGGATASVLGAALKGIPSIGDGARILLDSWTRLEQLRGSRARSLVAAQRSAIELLKVHASTLLSTCSLVVLEDLPLWGPVDRDLLAALLTAAQCEVIATSEYASQLPSAPAAKAHHLLRSLVEWEEEECISIHDSLCGAGKRVFSVSTGDTGTPTKLGITRLEAAGETGEVRLAARVILRHLRNATTREPVHGSDILVIARGRRYRELISEIFAQSGIGVDTLPSRSASEAALASVLIDAVTLAADADGGTRDQALRLLRTVHLDLGARAADRLERQIVLRGYLGLSGWDDRALDGLGKRAINRVNRLKRAVAAARESLAVASVHQDMAVLVRRLAKQLRLMGNGYFARRRVMNGEPLNSYGRLLDEQAVREDSETWEVVEEILDDTMPELLRVSDISAGDRAEFSFAREWLILFKRALAAKSRVQRFSGDELVRVAGASNGDCQPAKITIVLGLRQQAFPRQPRQNPFLPDLLCEQLRKHGIFVPASEDVADRERDSFMRAISTANKMLYLSYPITNADGKPVVTSFFIEDLQRAIGVEKQFGIERLGVTTTVPSVEDATSEAELLATIAHDVWQRLPVTVAARGDRAASFAAWNELVTNNGQVVAQLSSGRVAHRHPSFDRKTLAHAPHVTLELSASQLKTIQHCTYQHFIEKVLHPADLVAPEYDSLVKGSLIHDAMVRWVKLDGWVRGEAALGELDGWFVARAAQLSPAARSSQLAQFTIEKDRARLLEFVRGELDAASGSDAARPTYNELAFGARATKRHNRDSASVSTTFDLQVDTSMGERTVKFTGSIDRVDTFHVDGIAHGIALDYKTGETSDYYASAMEDGSDLQLRLYLLALERLWNIKPEGALYVGFGDGVRRGVISENATGRIGRFDEKCVTVMAPDAWDDFMHAGTERMIQALIERLVTFDIVASPYKGDCGFCKMGPICRYDPYIGGIADE